MKRWRVSRATGWAVLGVSLATCLAMALPSIARQRELRRFEAVTGLQLPSSAAITQSESEETGPFQTDGYRGIELAVDLATINSWLKSQPFEGMVWKRGPVEWGGLGREWDIPPQARAETGDVYYAVKDLGHDGGAELVVDPVFEKAWLVEWW
jgi:hypothetical protein